MIEKWKTVEDTFIYDLKIFKARYKKRVNPANGIESEFVMLDSPNWANIIPITTDNKIVMVEQYRHGTDTITLELPGGMVEKDEEPSNAAMRECIEETGYVGEGIPEKLGFVHPNPAFLNNICSTFLWKNCELKFAQNLDKDELIKIKTYGIDEIKDFIKSGKISHGIILNAFFYYFMSIQIKNEVW